jgi:spore coat protein U-like protein
MRNSLRSAIALALLVAAGSAFAGSSPQTGSFTVTASVAKSCLVSATSNIAFGAYDPLATADKDAAGSVTIKCSAGVTGIVVTLDAGANAGTGSTAAAPVRQMASGADRLPYQIYSNSGRTAVWGGTAATGVTIAGPTAAATPAVLPTYGRIAVGTDAPVGTYSDTVGVTATF